MLYIFVFICNGFFFYDTFLIDWHQHFSPYFCFIISDIMVFTIALQKQIFVNWLNLYKLKLIITRISCFLNHDIYLSLMSGVSL